MSGYASHFSIIHLSEYLGMHSENLSENSFSCLKKQITYFNGRLSHKAQSASEELV